MEEANWVLMIVYFVLRDSYMGMCPLQGDLKLYLKQAVE